MHNESILKLMDSRQSVGDVVKGIAGKGVTAQESAVAGENLVAAASKYGLNLRDYLDAAITPEGDIGGYELAKAELILPTKTDLKSGVALEAASDTFNTFPGSRALFPEVIDDVLQWANRQTAFENVAPMLASSRVTNGPELLFTIVDDDSAARKSHDVPELGRIPTRSISTSQNTVTFHKVGSGIKVSYEFTRRARLDIIAPFMARIARELEQDKVRHATNLVINGDGAANGAINVVAQSAKAVAGVTPTAGQLSYLNFLMWLVDRAKAGTPVDTILVGWDGFFEYNRLFAQPISGNTQAADQLRKAGVNLDQFGNIGLNLSVRPVLSSAVPAGQLIGITKGEALGELIEANSNIEESQKLIRTQATEIYKTQNVGYQLIYGDAREAFDYTA